MSKATISFKLGHQREIASGRVTSTVRPVFGRRDEYQEGAVVEVMAGAHGNFVRRPARVTSVKDAKLGTLTPDDLDGGVGMAHSLMALNIMLDNAYDTHISPYQAVQVVRFEYLD